MLEGVNYMEHYGLVREEGAPIEPKHSWNTNKRISSVLLYNLTRHSSHHIRMPTGKLFHPNRIIEHMVKP